MGWIEWVRGSVEGMWMVGWLCRGMGYVRGVVSRLVCRSRWRIVFFSAGAVAYHWHLRQNFIWDWASGGCIGVTLFASDEH